MTALYVNYGVSIFYVSDANAWATYLKEKLEDEKIEIDTELIDIQHYQDVKKENVNVVLISPDLVEMPSWDFLRQFDASKSIAVLMNIDIDAIDEIGERKNFPSIHNFFLFELEESADAVKGLLMAIIGLWEGPDEGGSWHLGVGTPILHQKVALSESRARSPEQSEPVYTNKNDLEGSLEDPNRDSGASFKSDYDFLPQPRPISIVSDVAVSNYDRDRVYVVLDNQVEDDVKLVFQGGAELETTLTKKQVYCVEGLDNTAISVDDAFALPTEFQVKSNGKVLGDGSLKQAPISNQQYQVLRQNLKEGRQELDSVKKSLGTASDQRPVDNMVVELLKIDQRDSSGHGGVRGTRFPTLLHFGARFNLIHFCEVLLDKYRMYDACVTENCDGDLPHAVAFNAGHVELGTMLEYMSTSDWLNRPLSFTGHDSGFAEKRVSTSPPPPPPQPHRTSSEGYTRPPPPRPVDHSFKHHRFTSADHAGSIEEEEKVCSFPDVSCVNSANQPDHSRIEAHKKQGAVRASGLYSEVGQDEDDFSVKLRGISRQKSVESRNTLTEDGDNIVQTAIDRPVDLHIETSQNHHGHPISKSHGNKKSFSPVTSPPPSSPKLLHKQKKDKAPGFMNFLKKKSKSKSDLGLGELDIAVKSGKIHRKTSLTSPIDRASEISSSSASTCSSRDSGSRLSELELSEDQVMKRKGKHKMKNLLNAVSRRKSIRIKHTKEHQNILAPSLPEGRNKRAVTLGDF